MAGLAGIETLTPGLEALNMNAAEVESPNPSFYLVPLNTAAREAVGLKQNRHFQSTLPDDGRIALSITIEPDTLQVTLGCGAADIFLPDKRDAEISKIHCAFVAARETSAVVLVDKSKKRNTEVYDDNQFYSIPISKGANSVVVSMGFNRRIGIGYKRYYKFELKWKSDLIRGGFLEASRGPVFGPNGSKEPRYIRGDELGTGAYGSVYRAVDIVNGDLMAVKRFHALDNNPDNYAKREVKNLMLIHREAQNVCPPPFPPGETIGSY